MIIKCNNSIKNYTPVLIKTTHSRTTSASSVLNDLSNTIANNHLDESSEFEIDSDSEMQEENDSSSMMKQKAIAVIVIIDTASKDQTSGHEQSRRCHLSSKLLFNKWISVLLGTGSDRDILFHRKGASNGFACTERQVARSYHTSAGILQTKGQAKFEINFLEYSESKHHYIKPDVFEYNKME